MRRTLLVLAIGLSMLAACGPAGGGTTPPPGPGPSDVRTEELILPGSVTPTLVTYRVVGDLAVIGGDIVIGQIDPSSGDVALIKTASRDFQPQGTGITARSQLWPGGVIPYAIDGGIPGAQKQDILDAIAHWEAHTSIDFVERTSAAPQSLLFARRDGGLEAGSCLANIGASTESEVWLGAGCGFGEIVHAIGHSVGMYHEHQRHDRDEHVEVIEGNVREGFLHAFDRLPRDLSVQGYGYDSVMHDSARAFLRPDAPEGAVTIRVLAPGRDIGASAGLSVGDIATVEAMYDADRPYFSNAAVLGSGVSRTFTWEVENAAEETLACEIQVRYAAGWRTIASPDCAVGSHVVTFEETGTIPIVLGLASADRVHDTAFFLLDIGVGGGPGTTVSVTVSPTAVELAPGETTELTATVAGASDPSVAWSVTGGEIATGNDPVTYTAPLAEGTFTVTATSVEDPTASDTATVTVVAGSSEPRYTQEELAYFEEIAVGSEYGPDGWIARWEEDILLEIAGAPTSEDLAALDRVIGELGELIQPIHIQIVDDAPNMRMFFVPVSDFPEYEPDYQPGNFGFFTFDFTGRLGPEDAKHLARIYASTVLVSSTEISQPFRSHLIREELTRALGLGNDSSAYPESIFYDDYTTTTDFLDIDRTIIEMLYRRELTSDMTTSEVLSELAELRGDPTPVSGAAALDARRDPSADFGVYQAGGD